MQLTSDEVRDHIANGLIKAVAVDTSIFDRAGLRMESGVLGQLHALAATDLQFILPEIVYQEISAHVRQDAAEKIRGAQKALREVSGYWHPVPAEMSTTIAMVDQVADDGRAQADERFRRFLMSVRASLVPTSRFSDVDSVVKAYFEMKPPFGTGKKKDEFPDALALSSLEGWARQNETIVLAVSVDNDWKSYCGPSQNLVLVDDLATALSLCQSKIARDLSDRLSAEIQRGTMEGFLTELSRAIDEQSSEISADVTFDSVFSGEEEVWVDGVSIDQVTIEAWPLEFEPLSYENEKLVVHSKIPCVVSASGSIGFFVRDPIDKDEVSMGSTSVETHVNEELEVVITVSIHRDEPWSIEDVDVEPTRVSIDFGHVQPDWMRDPNPDDAND